MTDLTLCLCFNTELAKSYGEDSEGESQNKDGDNNYATTLLEMSEMEEIHGSNRMFLAFFVMVIPDVVGRLKYRRFWSGRRERRYEELVSVADEGFGMLLLQNNLAKWDAEVRACYNNNVKIPDSAFTPHARKRNRDPLSIVPARKEGWSRDGLKRYNELCSHVIKTRSDRKLMAEFNACVKEKIDEDKKRCTGKADKEEVAREYEEDEEEIEVYSGSIELFGSKS